ncbi:Sodium/hydrogen exchanger 3 [Datura stramonium]|uniref:Sodium/hydrogen exchanger 3 n=1 Tax=Datura stramonium TaxID=4076 RepID=A0ABS8VEM1_DATST|nr:Sodium/hydrogen exchanger 3 [Datura stramonium]
MGLDAVARLGVRTLSDNDQFSPDSITLFVALLCGCIVIGHLLEESRWINDSITALVIGLCTGCIILFTTNGKRSHLLEFDEQLFFNYVLPPIIFNAAFQVKKKQFFRNFMTIMLFGAVGTLISFSIISIAIGAIFSATDSVCTLQVLNQDKTPLLYSLVFGEGVVNDATSVVLFNAIQKLDLSHINSRAALLFTENFLNLFLASTFLGVLVGLLSAYLIKKTYPGRYSTVREVSLVILMAYHSYMMAELFDLSGILTVFFCGIVMSHYTWHNVTTNSKVSTRHAFATLSFIAEVFIFLYVGMDALDMEKWRFVKDSPGKSVGVSATLLGLVLVGRACFVFPLSLLSNCLMRSKHEKLGLKQQVTIWWAGLMRGSVSMALAYNQFTRFGHTRQPGHAIMITSTITIVLFSTVVFGLITKPLVRFLLPSSKDFDSLISSGQTSVWPLLISRQEPEAEMGNVNFHLLASLSMLLKKPSHIIHNCWRKIDDGFMRPLFGGRGFVPDAPGLSKGGCVPY